MNTSNELNEIDIRNHTCHYFDDIINILTDNKSYDDILVYTFHTIV